MRHTRPNCRAFARAAATLALMTSIAACASSGTPASVTPTPVVQQANEGPPLTRAEILLGEYGRYRANNDLLYYHLDVRLDPDKQFLSGKNTIRFRMLSDDNRIQIDLHQALNVDSILLGRTPLEYTREERAVFIDFPETLKKGRTASIDFYYSGTPAETGRRGAGGGGGGVTFRTDANGKPFINTVCEGTGSSTWWPSKDQWHDEVESVDISVTVPNGLTDVSNGVFVGKTDLGDGYKLVEASNAGMEHQSAVTYGNGFKNGYGGRDWTGVGISPRFDFIIIHESGHEWFGNAVSAADRSDMWIHEGWTTYLEDLYVEYMYGYADAIRYVNGYKTHVRNRQPIIPPGEMMRTPPQDMYFKGALMLNTLRSVVNDDARWFKLLHDTFQHFKYQNITTKQVVQYFNQQTAKNLTPIFDQYLRHTALPTLELEFDDAAGTVAYRWQADEPAFAMPIRVGSKDEWQIIQPTTTEWKTLRSPLKKDAFQVATDLYFVNVTKE